MPIASTYFPDVNVLPNYRRQRVHATLISESFGKSQKMPLLPAGGRRRYTFNTMPMQIADRAALLVFIGLQRGGLGTFYFFDKARTPYAGLVIIASFDGSTMFPPNLVLPFKESVITQMYDDGDPVTFGFSAGTGPGGEDVVTSIIPTPAEFSVITADITGRERVIVRQDSDTEDEGFLEAADEYGSSTIALIEEL